MISSIGLRRFLAPLLLAIFLAHGPASASPPPDEELARGLAALLSRAPGETGPAAPHPFETLEKYPLTATAAYLLLGDDPNLLRSLYPRIQAAVMESTAPARQEGPGLLAGDDAESPAPTGILSPALNALACVELWSLHLIAWKTGACEDALEYLAWARSFSETVTQSFYVPERGRFHPTGGSGTPIPIETPPQLLPLVLDATLGGEARGRMASAAIERLDERISADGEPFPLEGMWRDPLMRPVVLDLLSTVPEGGAALAAATAAALPADTASRDPARTLWIDFWRSNPSRRIGLFPKWRTHPALVHLVLLLEREAFIDAEETSALASAVDSLQRALAADTLGAAPFAEAIAGVNRLMSRIGRLASLVVDPKERWRVADTRKWIRLSPRAKRLVSESFTVALGELVAAKERLAGRLEAGAEIAFDLSFPDDPVKKGSPAAFVCTLSSERKSLSISEARLRIGGLAWTVVERGGAAASVAPGAPLRYSGTLALPPGAEPGIVPLDAALEIRADGRLLELRRRESVVLAPPYRASMELPEGRRIGTDPLPVAITVWYRPDHDIRGTVDGSFMKELSTSPPLPARFLASASRDRTDLVLSVSPQERLAPGRYPFSVAISLEAGTIAQFTETLVFPFRWLYLAPLASAEAFRRGPEYQKDLFGGYAVGGLEGVRWRELPDGALDEDGAVAVGALGGGDPVGCVLLYTAVNAPAAMKLRWSVEASERVSIWINGAPVLSEGSPGSVSGAEPAEIRKGPNSILIAACPGGPRGRMLFELADPNGYPAAGLRNDLESIIDGYDRLRAPAAVREAGGPAAGQRMVQVSFSLARPGASEVSLIGSFNNWDPAANPMKRDIDGVWRAALVLKPGRHAYKFYVDRKSKIVDPSNPLTEADGFGGQNSVREVK